MARILVIEDNPDNLELMTYLLKAFGHETVSAEDGEQGMAVAQSQRFELIVCDIHLPKLDGYQVALQLKSNPALASLPLVAVTAFAMVGDRDRILSAGFDDYITKPIAPEHFVSQLERLLPHASWGSPPQSMATTVSAPPPQAVQLDVLVIDDSPSNRELLGYMLQSLGCHVRLCACVQEGLAEARAHVPDLVLSDLHMPNEDGFSLIGQMKADPHLASVPLIILSATLWEERDRQRAICMAVDGFLQRPVEPRILLEEINRCLARHHVQGLPMP